MPGVAMRPALEIVDFFIVLACTEVDAKFPKIRIDVVDSAKNFRVFERNILGCISLSISPLFRGDVIKRMRAISFQYKDICGGRLSSPQICMDTRQILTVQIQVS
jgi:hypothetical protein